jgi:hypothetical protein
MNDGHDGYADRQLPETILPFSSFHLRQCFGGQVGFPTYTFG